MCDVVKKVKGLSLHACLKRVSYVGVSKHVFEARAASTCEIPDAS